MAPLHFNEALGFLYESVGVINTLWNFFSIVALGVVGLAYGKDYIHENKMARLWLTIGFGLFALANGYVVRQAQETYVRIVDTLKHAASAPVQATAGPGNAPVQATAGPVNFAPVIDGLEMDPAWMVVVYHVVLALFVVLALWAPELKDRFWPTRR
ncbi:MAG TPA: hypothetical protein VGR37_21140 [Longimicrobiaceae bacterium]|nr:hypothetical protein [Longimicrobiaceae bacterium]